MRIILNIALFISVFTLPWWASSFLVLVYSIYFYRFYEGVIYGLILDSLFFASIEKPLLFSFFFTTLFTILVVLGIYVRSQMRLKNHEII